MKSQKIKVYTETTYVKANGWVETGEYYKAWFKTTPAGVRGNPLGRSQENVHYALRDLLNRTNSESGTSYKVDDILVVSHKDFTVDYKNF